MKKRIQNDPSQPSTKKQKLDPDSDAPDSKKLNAVAGTKIKSKPKSKESPSTASAANTNNATSASTPKASAASGEPKKRKFNMTKQRKMALAAAQAEAIARGEKPPTIDQLDLAAITKKSSKKAKKLKEKSSKPKAPVDVEKQCGVPHPNGTLCARSLTCKTHSMSAKRAVRGRSVPYDILLARYQKLNQVKLASMSTVQQLADENEALGGSEVNEDEEVKQVMEGVARSKPMSLEQKVILPIRTKKKFIKMREMFASALLPVGVRPLNGFLGRSLTVNPNDSQDVHFIRPVHQVLKQQQLLQLHAQRQKQAQARSLAQQQLIQQQLRQQSALQGQQTQANTQQTTPAGQPIQQQLLYQQQLMYQRQMLQNTQQNENT